jgi:hypothetical protein
VLRAELVACFQVHWVEQQHEKRRKKRDYSEPNFPAFGDYPSFFGTGASALQEEQHQPQYRGIGPHNVFPDPLFKEEWYLVSVSAAKASSTYCDVTKGNLMTFC